MEFLDFHLEKSQHFPGPRHIVFWKLNVNNLCTVVIGLIMMVFWIDMSWLVVIFDRLLASTKKNGDTTVIWADKKCDQKIKEVPGRSTVCEAVQRRQLRGKCETTVKSVPQELQACLQMGSWWHYQEASQSQPLLPSCQGILPQTPNRFYLYTCYSNYSFVILWDMIVWI